jgi:hypothetical protein
MASMEKICTEQPVKNTTHNLIQTLSIKLDSAALWPLHRGRAERRKGARGPETHRCRALERGDRQEAFLSEATVRTHVGHILSKLRLRDRVQAFVLAYECGLIQPGEALATGDAH